MGRIFDNPVHLLILLLVIVVIFGANKLPGAARSLGRSMRIFKSEVEAMGDEAKPRSRQDLDSHNADRQDLEDRQQFRRKELDLDRSTDDTVREERRDRNPNDPTH